MIHKDQLACVRWTCIFIVRTLRQWCAASFCKSLSASHHRLKCIHEPAAVYVHDAYSEKVDFSDCVSKKPDSNIVEYGPELLGCPETLAFRYYNKAVSVL